MRKELYNQIKETLSSIYKHFDIWNDQLLYIEEVTPFSCPAIFIEFKPIHWKELSNGVKEADVIFDLHIVNNSIDNVLDNFDIIDQINSLLYITPPMFDGIGSISNITSDTDHNFDELQNNVETYTVHVKDSSQSTEYNKIQSNSARIVINTEV